MRRARRVQNCMIELPQDAFICLPCTCEDDKYDCLTKIHLPSTKKQAPSKVKKVQTPKTNTPPSLASLPSQSDQLEELQKATKYLKLKEQEIRRKTEELQKFVKECEARKKEQNDKENTLKRFSKLKDIVKSNHSCTGTCKHEAAKQKEKNLLCSRCNAEIHGNGNQGVKGNGKQNKELIKKNNVQNDVKGLLKKNIHNDVYNKVYNELMTMQVKRGLLDRLNALVQPPPSMWPNWYWLRQLLPNPCSCLVQGLPPLRSPFTACATGTPQRCGSKTPSETNQSMQAGNCKTEAPQAQQAPYEVLSHGLLLLAATLAWFPCLCCLAACKCCFCLCCHDLL